MPVPQRASALPHAVFSEKVREIFASDLYFVVTHEQQCVLIEDGPFKVIYLSASPDLSDYIAILEDNEAAKYETIHVNSLTLFLELLAYCVRCGVDYVLVDEHRFEADVLQHFLLTGNIKPFGRLAQA